jgi:polyisoprenoid-binding protein YceI
VLIELRATGLLRAVGHDPILVARAEPLVLEVPEGEIDAPLEARFRVDAIEPPADIDASDREKMRDNMRGRDVLDAARFPTVALRGRYKGNVERGRLEGELEIRGKAHRVAMDVSVTREWDVLVATGAWEGRLTELGIKPFRALLGALRLEDWVRLRIDARFRT